MNLNDKNIIEIKNKISSDNLLALGVKREPFKKSIFRKKKDVELFTLCKERQMENIFITGGGGSAKSYGMYSVMLSSIVYGRGFVFFDLYSDDSMVDHVLKLAKLYSREKDVVYFNNNQIKNVDNNTIADLIKSNKIVLFPSLYFLKNEAKKLEVETLISKYINELLELKYVTPYYPYTVFLSELGFLSINFIKNLVDSIKRLNKCSVNFCLSNYGYYERKNIDFTKDILSVVKNHLIFKSEEPEILKEIFTLDHRCIRDLKYVNTAEFHYAYNNEINFTCIYKSFYI